VLNIFGQNYNFIKNKLLKVNQVNQEISLLQLEISEIYSCCGSEEENMPTYEKMGEHYPERDGIKNTVIGKERTAKIKLLKEFVMCGVRKPCL